jgi:hypothetical protein
VFGGTTLCLLAFAFTYWRITQDSFVLLLSIALLTLLVLSTSSTAYVGGALLFLWLLISISKSALKDRLTKQDLLLLLLGAAALATVIATYLVNEKALDPFWQLFNETILDKTTSSSGQQRAYWNSSSLQSFYDTSGLGVGLGSSRASSWIVAVISQLGLIGSLMIAFLTAEIVRGSALRYREDLDPEIRAIALSLRASALAILVSASIGGASADPGIIFFIALAAILNLRARPSLGRRQGVFDYSVSFTENDALVTRQQLWGRRRL